MSFANAICVPLYVGIDLARGMSYTEMTHTDMVKRTLLHGMIIAGGNVGMTIAYIAKSVPYDCIKLR